MENIRIVLRRNHVQIFWSVEIDGKLQYLF
jgi:hypothetical protein